MPYTHSSPQDCAVTHHVTHKLENQFLEPYHRFFSSAVPSAMETSAVLPAGLHLPPAVASIHALTAAACGLLSRTRGRARLHEDGTCKEQRIEQLLFSPLTPMCVLLKWCDKQGKKTWHCLLAHTAGACSLPRYPPHDLDCFFGRRGLSGGDEQRCQHGGAAAVPVRAVDVHRLPCCQLLLCPVNTLLDLQGVGRCRCMATSRRHRAAVSC